MKIGFLTSEYPDISIQFGGIATGIKNLAEALVKSNHKVTIYIYGQPNDETQFYNGLRIVCIKNIQVKGLSWLFTRLKIQKIIREDVRNKMVEIVEVPDWTGISAWMKLNCPIVMRLNGSDTYFCHIENRKVKWWNKLLEKTAYRQADHIIAVSEFVGTQSNLVFECHRSFTVIPNSVQYQNFENYSTPITFNNTILYIGTLIRKKGVMDIPYIFNLVHQSHPDAQLVLIGADSFDIQTNSASTWKLMQNLFTPEALAKVIYKGKIPYQQVQSHFALADVCIFPSYAEALPLSWLEAMAMGKAVVTSNIGWALEIIEDSVNGFMVHPKDHTTYAQRVGLLLDDHHLNQKFGKHAQETIAQKFDSAVTAEMNIRTFKQLVKHA